MSEPITAAKIPAVPGVEQLDEAPAGAVRLLGPYFADELAELVAAARGLRDRARHCIAPDGENFSIYRRGAEGK